MMANNTNINNKKPIIYTPHNSFGNLHFDITQTFKKNYRTRTL